MEERTGDSNSPEIRTGPDRLLELVTRSKEVSMAAAAKQLGVPSQTIEAWSDFLEEDGFVAVKYKFTTPYIAIPDATKAGKKKEQPAVQAQGEGLEFAALKGEFSVVQDLLDRAAEEKMAGEFGVLKETYDNLLPKLKASHDKLLSRAEVSPQKKVQLNETFEALEPLLRAAVDDVSKGRFDYANLAYAKLYSKTKDLIGELNRIYGQITTLETVQDSNDYRDLLEKAYQLMSEGHVEEARQLYEKLRFAHENLAKSFIEKKRQMEDDIVKLNTDLAKNVDQLNLQKLADKMRRINLLLDSGNKLLKRGNFDAAEKYYVAIRQEYSDLPTGFHDDKKGMQQKILRFYSGLSEQRERIINGKFEGAVKQIDSLAKEAKQLVKEGNVKSAISMYDKIRQLYNTLPRGFLKEKAQIQEKILSFYGALNTIYTEESLNKLKSMSAQIVSLIGIMKSQTAQDKLDEAEATYEQINRLYKQIPKGFLHEETSLQNQIMQAYNSYLNKTKQVGTSSTTAMLHIISKLLEQGERQFKQKNYDVANNTYLKLIEVYNGLPSGFPEQKREIREKALRLYKKLLSTRNTKESFDVAKSEEIPDLSPPLPQPAPIIEDMQGNDYQTMGSRAPVPRMLSDTGLLEDSDKTLESLHKKIEELKGLTKATVKLPL